MIPEARLYLNKSASPNVATGSAMEPVASFQPAGRRAVDSAVAGDVQLIMDEAASPVPQSTLAHRTPLQEQQQQQKDGKIGTSYAPLKVKWPYVKLGEGLKSAGVTVNQFFGVIIFFTLLALFLSSFISPLFPPHHPFASLPSTPALQENSGETPNADVDSISKGTLETFAATLPPSADVAAAYKKRRERTSLAAPNPTRNSVNEDAPLTIVDLLSSRQPEGDSGDDESVWSSRFGTATNDGINGGGDDDDGGIGTDGYEKFTIVKSLNLDKYKKDLLLAAVSDEVRRQPPAQQQQQQTSGKKTQGPKGGGTTKASSSSSSPPPYIITRDDENGVVATKKGNTFVIEYDLEQYFGLDRADETFVSQVYTCCCFTDGVEFCGNSASGDLIKTAFEYDFSYLVWKRPDNVAGDRWKFIVYFNKKLLFNEALECYFSSTVYLAFGPSGRVAFLRGVSADYKKRSIEPGADVEEEGEDESIVALDNDGSGGVGEKKKKGTSGGNNNNNNERGQKKRYEEDDVELFYRLYGKSPIEEEEEKGEDERELEEKKGEGEIPSNKDQGYSYIYCFSR